MKILINPKIGLILLLLLSIINTNFAVDDSLEIFSPKYFNEQRNIYDEIHYLDSEQLSFSFCAEESNNVSFTILCENIPKSLEIFENQKTPGCYFSNYNLNELDCSTFDLEINYEVNNKKRQITRSFKKQKESLLINHVLSKDYLDLSPEELSYYLIVLNEIQDQNNKENIEAYEKLKNDRDNENKCWPNNNCDLETTSKILRNLIFSSYTLDSRIIEDGQFYLEKKLIEEDEAAESSTSSQDYQTELIIKHNFASGEEIACEMTIDNDEVRNYIFDEDSDRDYLTIGKEANSQLQIDCDDSLENIYLRIFEEKISQEDYDNEDNIDYTISSTDINDFSEFKYKIDLVHEFQTGEEIICDLTIDDNLEDTYIFDEYSEINELTLEGELNEYIELDCDENIDEIYLDIYANELDNQEFNDESIVEYSINDNSQKTYNFVFEIDYDFTSSSDELECTLKTDDTYSTTYVFDEDDEGEIEISNKHAANEINLDCNKEVKDITLKLYDIFDRLQIIETKEETDILAYTIGDKFSDYYCVGEKTCDFETTINTLYTYGSKIKEYDKIKDYLDSLISIENENEQFIQTSNELVDTGKYLTYTKNDELSNYLKFKQNNEGSWGSEEQITKTIWSVLGLSKNEANSEHVTDGKKWIYFNEPSSGWGSIEKNSLAFLAIKESLKPYLKISTINQIKNHSNISLENPTIYELKNIKVKFSDEINDELSYTQDLGELKGEENVNFEITVNKDFYGTKTGEMTITGIDGKNKEIELIKTPINIVGQDLFTISQENTILSDDENIIKLNVHSNISNYDFKCTYINPFLEKNEEVLLLYPIDEILVSNPMQTSGNYTLEFECKYNKDDKFKTSFDLEVIKLNRTFEVIEKEKNISGLTNFSINVQNTNLDRQVIEFEIQGDLKGIVAPIDTNKVIAKNETREIYFQITNPDLLLLYTNTTNSKIVIKGESGYKKEIPLNIYLIPEETGLSLTWYIIIIFLTLTLIIFMIRRYRQLQYEEEITSNKKQDNDMMFDDLEFED